MAIYIVLGIVVLALIYGVVIYNNLVTLKHNVSQAWSNIDVILKQRHDELPKLVEVCKQYMGYESETLQRIIEARSAVYAARDAGDMAKLGAAEGQLRLGLGNLFAVAEQYPELKANEQFQHLQGRISGLENDIAGQRVTYNAAVNANNIQIEQFPDVIVARMFNFKSFDLLEFSDAEKADVDIKKLFQ